MYNRRVRACCSHRVSDEVAALRMWLPNHMGRFTSA